MFTFHQVFLTREFGREAALLNAYNQRRLGIRAVPVAAITGTVGRPELCTPSRVTTWKQTGRYRAILNAMNAGECLPPVELYLLDGHYYIRDGHHWVAAAFGIGILDVDAEVTEYLPRPTAPAAAWHRARASFERDTGLVGMHVRRLDGYEWLRRQIAEHAWYLGERVRAPGSFAEAAAVWEREVYRPVVSDLAGRGVLGRVADLTTTEIYLALCEYKWYRSERLERDVGFAAAVASYSWTRRHPWLDWLGNWLESTRVALARQLGKHTTGLAFDR